MPTTTALWHGPASPLAQTASYEVSLATTLEEVRACQCLRYEVFNGELGEGLESSHALGLDRDRFDVICDHLLVRDTHTGEVVGTYRMQTGYRAKGNAGYYSEEFFDFAPYEGIRCAILEARLRPARAPRFDGINAVVERNLPLHTRNGDTLLGRVQFADVAGSRGRSRPIHAVARGASGAGELTDCSSAGSCAAKDANSARVGPDTSAVANISRTLCEDLRTAGH